MTASTAPQAKSRGNAVLWVLAFAVLAGLILFIGRNQSDGSPYDPFSISENGTQAMMRVLDRAGADVDIRKGLPSSGDDIALILVDRFQSPDPESEDRYFDDQVAIRQWVDEGGTLVVADPSSTFLPGELTGSGIPGDQCDIEALADIDELDPEVDATPMQVAVNRQFCFGDGGRALVVKADSGAGSIVYVGTRDHWENEFIGRADHGALAVALLAPSGDTNLVVLTGPTNVDDPVRGLSDLIPSSVKWGIALASLGFLLYALGRVPRHGRPVREPQLVEIAGSELVLATGHMLEQSRTFVDSAETLKSQVTRDLARGLHMPAAAPRQQVVAQVAARLAQEPGQIDQLLAPGGVANEDDLAALATNLDQLIRAVLREPSSNPSTTHNSEQQSENYV